MFLQEKLADSPTKASIIHHHPGAKKGSNESFRDIVTWKVLFDVVALRTICHVFRLYQM
jgi:hypothetical protein